MANNAISDTQYKALMLMVLLAILGLGAYLFISLPDDGTPKKALPQTKDTVFLVNDAPISAKAIQIFSQELAAGTGDTSSPMSDAVNVEVINRELLQQELESPELQSDSDLVAKAESLKRTVASQLVVDHFMVTHPATPDELKKEYDQQTLSLKGTEYKVRHILLASEDAAHHLILRISKGEAVDRLAKQYSLDLASKHHGGDLGWTNLKDVSPPLAEAVRGLTPGTITAKPVHSLLGWHVVQLEDTREMAKPSFDAIQEDLISSVQARKLQQHIAELRKKAKIVGPLPGSN
jgi:peptidyl-prolyl cis-trans isomerase C